MPPKALEETEEDEKQPLLESPRDPEKAERQKSITHGKTFITKKTLGGGADEDVEDGDEETGQKGSRGCCAAMSEKCKCCGSWVCCCCDHGDEDTPHEQKKTPRSNDRFKLNHNGKMYQYNHERLLTWQVFMGWTGTVFVQRAVYIVLPYVAFLALVFGVAVFAGIPHARKLDTGRFNDFVNYIKVFIAFMLGLFLNNAFKRWWSSVSYFKRFLISIKQLMFTMHAIGVRKELLKETERLCIVSSYVLNEEVHCAQIQDAKERSKRWEESLNRWVKEGQLTPGEREDLEEQSRCTEGAQSTLGVMSTLIWIWVGETMTQVKAEPKVAPPMYVRLLFLCQDCMAQVELLKTNLLVQLPFTYVHLLCALVHLTNILLAISCGLTIGSALAEVHTRTHQIHQIHESHEGDSEEAEAHEYFLLMRVARYAGVKVMDAGYHSILAELYQAVQQLGMQFIMLLFQPIIYQAFLVIAHALCYPYGQGICHMPTETFIQQVQYELQVIHTTSDSHKERRERIFKEKQSGID